MPYKLKGLSVVNADTGKVIKTHKSKAQALKHLAALNINVTKNEQVIESQGDAPGYMPSSDVAQTCLGCQFANSYENKCRLYNFTFEPWYICESYRARPERNYFESTITPHIAEGKEFEGKEWEVTIIGPKTNADIITIEGEEYLRSLNDRLYSLKGLEDSVSQWQDAQVYDNHLTQQEFVDKQGMRSPMKEWLGAIVNPFWDKAAKSLKGFLRIADEAAAKKFKNAYDLDILKTIGLSIDTKPLQDGMATVEGIVMPLLKGFEEIFSLDVVGRPAAGGSFDRITAAIIYKEKTDMTPEEVQDLINTAITGLNIAETVRTTLAEALNADEDKTETEAKKKPSMDDDMMDDDEDKSKKARKESDDAGQKALDRVAQLESDLLVKQAISDANLSEKLAEAARVALSGRVIQKREIEDVLKSLKEAQAQTDPTGNDDMPTGQRRDKVKVGWTEQDKYAVEFARLLMGNNAFSQIKENKEDKNDFVSERLNEADWYLNWKKNNFQDIHQAYRISSLMEEWFGGNPLINPRAMETATTSTLATVVKNTVNIMIAADYSLQQRWYESIVRQEEVDTIDDTTLARLFGVNTLSVVPEGDTYTELALADEEETASFVKQGNYIGVTMETLMRDKLNYVRTIPRRLSDTWYNTLSAHVAAVFTTNSATGPVLSDTGALFNATVATTAGGHANLLTTALSTVATYAAARTAMRKQTNQPLGVGRKVQIEPKYLLVPEDLETTGLTIRNSQYIPGSANNDINPFYQKFEVVVVPDWTDATDWALVADPVRWPAIWLIFPRGNRTPQLFTADSAVAGAMFTNDTLRFKVQMLHYRFSPTYSNAPVADFRPLHKSNVA